VGPGRSSPEIADRPLRPFEELDEAAVAMQQQSRHVHRPVSLATPFEELAQHLVIERLGRDARVSDPAQLHLIPHD
jgi:hypothetical protein